MTWKALWGLSERRPTTTMNPWTRTTPDATKSRRITRVCWTRSRNYISMFDSIIRACAPLSSRLSFAADLFLGLVIGRQTLLAMLGIETDPAQSDQQVQAAV